MENKDSLLWHDYETTGTNPQRDRISQFAAIRTDANLNIIDEPINLFCQPALDTLPSPDAVLVTGITPQQALQQGLPEYQFIAHVHKQFIQPKTCGVGYNNIRFDDEFSRYALYRNFYDAYEREWNHGNSRWDIIDMVRLVYALRPDTLNWPEATTDVSYFVPSFKLENLSITNNLTHDNAHDALSDVNATIELAKLIKQREPKLYDYCWQLRRKQKVLELTNIRSLKPLLHISSKFSSKQACASIVLPFMAHPVNTNAIVTIDLAAPVETDSSPEQLQQRLYSSNEQLEKQGLTRLPIKIIHTNRSPIVATTRLVDDDVQTRMRLSRDTWQQHYAQWLEGDKLIKFKTALQQILEKPFESESSDPEHLLYDGFLSNNDKRLCQQIVKGNGNELRDRRFVFEASKLNELLWRYRARNFPQSLSAQEQQEWQNYRKLRLTDASGGASLTIEQYRQRLNELHIELRQCNQTNSRQSAILQSLEQWGDELLAS